MSGISLIICYIFQKLRWLRRLKHTKGKGIVFTIMASLLGGYLLGIWAVKRQMPTLVQETQHCTMKTLTNPAAVALIKEIANELERKRAHQNDGAKVEEA